MSKNSSQKKPINSALFMGIDMGTSGIRVSVIDELARQVAMVTLPLPSPKKSGNGISQDPSIWARVLEDALQQATSLIEPDKLKSIAIDGTSGTVLIADSKGNPIGEALMYNDGRSVHQVEQLRSLTRNSVVQSVSAGLPKLMWLNEHQSSRTAKYALHQADWLSFLLTGRPGHSDVNNCLKTGFDPFVNKWPDWLEQLHGIRNLLPEVHEPGQAISTISPVIAQKYGLPASMEIIAGTTDSHAAILATGIREPGEAVTSLGSTLVTKVISEVPVFDANYGVYSQPFGQGETGKRLWLVGGGSNSGGAVLRHFFTDEQMRIFSENINPDLDTGLTYYPLLEPGERFPINDPDFAPRLSPRPEDDVVFFQGLLEGIARIEHQAYQLLSELGTPYPKTIHTVGGGSKNKRWTAIRARYCQTEITQSEYTEAAYGSALLARQGYQDKSE